jgi:hypothetical protein
MGSLSGTGGVSAFDGVLDRARAPGPGERPNLAPGDCPRGLRGDCERIRVTGDVDSRMDVPMVSRRGARAARFGDTAGDSGCFDG